MRFRDIRDLKSVEKVDPDNLAASFGKGVTLKRITVQLTEDPVTTDIGKRLPWLGDTELGLDNDFAPTTNATLAQRLAHSDFRRKAHQ